MIWMRIFRSRWLLAFGVLVAVCATGCQAVGNEPDGPGMTLVYGSVIDGRSIAVKTATLPNGHPFPQPRGVGGVFKKGQTWKHGGVSATMAASGDYRGVPEWVDFVWSEPPYPEDARMSLEQYRALPKKTQRLEIKRRVPQSVVDEVIASKRIAQPGKVANKTLWIYIFWTPDGMKMRWAMRDQAVGSPGGFGDVVHEGGDNLDQYNR